MPAPSTAIGPFATGGSPPSVDQLVGAERGDALRGGLEVVDQLDARDAEAFRQRVAVHDPGQVGGAADVVLDRPGDPEAGVVGLGAGADLRGRIGQELLREHIQPRVRRRRVGLLEGRLHPAQPGGRDVVDREPRVGAADVTCQDRHGPPFIS